jgi:hypothetical protein
VRVLDFEKGAGDDQEDRDRFYRAVVPGSSGWVGGLRQQEANPEQTVNDFWSAVQKGDYKTAKTYLSSTLSTSTLDELGGAEVWQSKLFEELMGSVTMKTVSNTVNGDNATVTVEFIMPDMDVVGEAITEAISSGMGNVTDPSQINMEELGNTLLTKLPAIIKAAPTKTEKQDISLVWEDGTWKIKTDPFADIQGPM